MVRTPSEGAGASAFDAGRSSAPRGASNVAIRSDRRLDDLLDLTPVLVVGTQVCDRTIRSIETTSNRLPRAHFSTSAVVTVDKESIGQATSFVASSQHGDGSFSDTAVVNRISVDAHSRLSIAALEQRVPVSFVSEA